MQKVTPLEPGGYFHIYDRGVNRENIFREERNYDYFLALYAKHITPIAETFAYCLLRNHFHLLVRIRTQTEAVLQVPVTPALASKAFNNLLTAYAKAMNKAFGRTGAFFQHHFGRIPITSDRYFASLIRYIHLNPRKHGFVDDFRRWPYSSYHSLARTDAVSESSSVFLSRTTVLDWFGGAQGIRDLHATDGKGYGLGIEMDDDAD